MSIKQDLKQLFKPYYLLNLLLTFSYIVSKRTQFICQYIFSDNECELDGRETEILFFLVIVVMIRTRKAGSVTMINYLSSSFIYTKVANLLLWFYADIRLGILFGIIFVLSGLLFPEPTYTGPDNVIYFRGGNGLEDEMDRDKTASWLVTFYTVWNPACVNFAPTFAQLSSEYALENLKFGKVDVGRYPDAGKKHHVSDSSLSKQLPTVILFQNGKEIVRRPCADSKGKLVKFLFSVPNVKAAFDLNNVYTKCKEQLSAKPKKQQTKAKSD